MAPDFALRASGLLSLSEPGAEGPVDAAIGGAAAGANFAPKPKPPPAGGAGAPKPAANPVVCGDGIDWEKLGGVAAASSLAPKLRPPTAGEAMPKLILPKEIH